MDLSRGFINNLVMNKYKGSFDINLLILETNLIALFTWNTSTSKAVHVLRLPFIFILFGRVPNPTHMLLLDMVNEGILWTSSKLMPLEGLIFGSWNSKSLEESPKPSCTVSFKELLPLLPIAELPNKIFKKPILDWPHLSTKSVSRHS